MPMLAAAERYVTRCRSAGDRRPTVAMLSEIVDWSLARQLAAELEHRWVV